MPYYAIPPNKCESGLIWVPWNSDESAAIPPIPGEPWVYEAYAGDPAYKGRCVPIDQVDPASPFLAAPAGMPLPRPLLETPIRPEAPTVFIPITPNQPISPPLNIPGNTPLGPPIQSSQPSSPIPPSQPSSPAPSSQPSSPFPLPPSSQLPGTTSPLPGNSTESSPTNPVGSVLLIAGPAAIGYFLSDSKTKLRNGLLGALVGILAIKVLR